MHGLCVSFWNYCSYAVKCLISDGWVMSSIDVMAHQLVDIHCAGLVVRWSVSLGQIVLLKWAKPAIMLESCDNPEVMGQSRCYYCRDMDSTDSVTTGWGRLFIVILWWMCLYYHPCKDEFEILFLFWRKIIGHIVISGFLYIGLMFLFY